MMSAEKDKDVKKESVEVDEEKSELESSPRDKLQDDIKNSGFRTF